MDTAGPSSASASADAGLAGCSDEVLPTSSGHAGISLAPSVEPTAVHRSGEGLTCAICLDIIEPAALSLIPGCEHQYCVKCILHWAVHKESPWCPQCRVPFSRLQTYVALDGTLRDIAAEESVCLLKRTTWFQDYVQAREKGKAPAPAGSDVSIPPEVLDWHDYGQYYDEFDEDEEVADYYFSSAAGRARITLGNRRWGENGYVSSGRMHARPVAPARPAKGGKVGKSNQGEAGKPESSSKSTATSHAKPVVKDVANGIRGRAEAVTPTSGVGYTGGEGVCSSGGGCSSEGKGGGRRARRNARRAAADMRNACVFQGE